MDKEFCGGLCPFGEMHAEKPHMPIVNGDRDVEPLVGFLVDEDVEFDDEGLMDRWWGGFVVVPLAVVAIVVARVRGFFNRCSKLFGGGR